MYVTQFVRFSGGARSIGGKAGYDTSNGTIYLCGREIAGDGDAANVEPAQSQSRGGKFGGLGLNSAGRVGLLGDVSGLNGKVSPRVLDHGPPGAEGIGGAARDSPSYAHPNLEPTEKTGLSILLEVQEVMASTGSMGLSAFRWTEVAA